MAKRAQAVKASANILKISVHRLRHWNACRGPGDADQGRKHHGIEDHMASEFPRRKDRSARAPGVELLHDDRCGEHDHRDKHRRNRRGQHRRGAVSRLEDRKRDKAGVRHRSGPSLHRRPGKPLAAKRAQPSKDDGEAQQGPAAKRNEKAPRQQRSRRLVRDRDDQERRHRDVISEMDQGVGEIARDISERAGEPSGHDHREHRQDEIGDLHCSEPSQSGRLLSRFGNVTLRRAWERRRVRLRLPRGTNFVRRGRCDGVDRELLSGPLSAGPSKPCGHVGA